VDLPYGKKGHRAFCRWFLHLCAGVGFGLAASNRMSARLSACLAGFLGSGFSLPENEAINYDLF